MEDDPNYTQMAKLVTDLHRLIANGQGDSAEADSIRDACDETLSNLTAEARERIQRFSESLYRQSES